MNKKESSPIKAVVCDLFSTLTSLSHTPGAPGKKSHQIIGVSPDEWNRALFGNARERLIGEITDPIEIVKDIAWKINRSIPEETLNVLSEERQLRFKYCLENPPSGVLHSLREIKKAGYPLALISNADVTEISAWQSSELGTLFDWSVFSCYEGTMKPEEKIFRICLNHLGLRGKDCLYVGDGGDNELIASAKMGMTAVLTSQFIKVTSPEKVHERRKTVSHEISDLQELLPLINRINSNNE